MLAFRFTNQFLATRQLLSTLWRWHARNLVLIPIAPRHYMGLLCGLLYTGFDMITQIKYTLRWGRHAFPSSWTFPNADCMHFLGSCKCLVFLEDKGGSFLLVWSFCFWLLGLSGLLPYQTDFWLEMETFRAKDLTKQVNHTTFLQIFREIPLCSRNQSDSSPSVV